MEDNIREFIELIQEINLSNSEFDIATKIHSYLAYKYDVIESNIYLINVSGQLQRNLDVLTSASIDKIKLRLEEEGIIDWVFIKNQITFIPNIYDESASSKSFIIIVPVIVNDNQIGVFIAICSKDKNYYTELQVLEINSIGTHGTIKLDNIKKVTEIDNMNKRLRYLNNEVIRSSEKSSIGDIASGIASEIQSPIKIIEANLELLDSGFQNRERRIQIIKEQFDKILKINEKLNSLTNTNDENEITEKINIHDLANEVIMLTESQLRKDGIIIENEIPNTDIFAIGIKNQLEHILLSLILHSKDMMQEGGKITLNIVNKSRKVTISIQDSGVGFTEDQIKFIFDPAFDLKSGSEKISGLHIQQQIAKKFKGSIELVSEIGKGTTYKVILPAAAK